MDPVPVLSALAAELGPIRAARRASARREPPDFAPLSYGRFDENALSGVIGDLLDPLGSHGQGDAFLVRLLSLIGLHQHIGKCQYANVRLESSTHTIDQKTRRRVDIVVQGDTWALGIENKPWACDQVDQVVDYLRHLRAIGRGRSYLVYLTRDGSLPAAHSISEDECSRALNAGELILCSYSTIVKWLEECATCCQSDGVKWFLTYFRAHLNRNVIGELPDEETQMILDIALTPAHLQSTLDLLQSRDAIRRELIARMMSALRKIAPSDWLIVSELSNDSALLIRMPGIADGYFAIESEKNRWFYGLKRDGDKRPIESRAFDSVCANAHQRLPNNERMTEWWPYWRWFDGHRPEAPREYGYWDTSTQPWLDMTNGKMVDNFLALARDLCSVDRG